MTPEPEPAPRIPARHAAAVGAITALMLDGLLVVGLWALAGNGFYPAAAILLGALSGLVVAPIVGWRYGAAAAAPGLDWALGAFLTAYVVGTCVSAAYVIAITVLTPLSSPLDFFAFALFESVLYIGVFTTLVAAPAGFAWHTVMQASRRRAHRPSRT